VVGAARVGVEARQPVTSTHGRRVMPAEWKEGIGVGWLVGVGRTVSCRVVTQCVTARLLTTESHAASANQAVVPMSGEVRLSLRRTCQNAGVRSSAQEAREVAR